MSNVSYDLNDMRMLEKNIQKYGNELIGSLDKILKDMSILDDVYDTPTGKVFKEKFTDYINFEKKFIQDSYLPFKDIMKTIIIEYEKNENQIKKALGGK